MEEKTPYPAPPPPPPPPPPPGAPYPPPAPAVAPMPYASGGKSPVLAGFLSMFPGLGHLYLGLYQRGIVFGIAFVMCIGLAHRRGEFFGPVIAFIWFFAIIDAVRQAHAINRGYVAESGFGPSPAQIRRASSGTAGLTWGVILTGIGALWLIDRYVDIDWSFFDRWGAPAAFILLGLILIATHVHRKRRENESGVGMPPRTGG